MNLFALTQRFRGAPQNSLVSEIFPFANFVLGFTEESSKTGLVGIQFLSVCLQQFFLYQ